MYGFHTGHGAAVLVVPEARQASKLQAGRYVVRGLPKELTESAQGGSLSHFFCCLKATLWVQIYSGLTERETFEPG
jgi:hypothetical protein